MSLINVAGHTIEPSLLVGGWVLDAGSRDFEFSKAIVKAGCQVLALDADPSVENPKLEGVHFYNEAIAGDAGVHSFTLHENPEARGLTRDVGTAPGMVQVAAQTLTQWMDRHGIDDFDCIKLDVEGAEYAILSSWPGPVAKQITVEFHDHHWKRPPEVYERLFDHLAQWYNVVKFYPGDTLLVLKTLNDGAPAVGEPWWRS